MIHQRHVACKRKMKKENNMNRTEKNRHGAITIPLCSLPFRYNEPLKNAHCFRNRENGQSSIHNFALYLSLNRKLYTHYKFPFTTEKLLLH